MSVSRLPFSICSALLAAVLVGCPTPTEPDSKETGDTEEQDSAIEQPTDADADGVTPNDGDCDDNNAAIFPGQVESCNGIDDNCNEVVDEGLPDGDSDGVADCQDTETCDGVDNNGDGLVDEGYADADGNGVADCVGTEVCDGIDNNENGQVDEGFDADGDGYTSCGSDDIAADCDDSDPNVFPDAGEVGGDSMDNDCDGLVDEGDWASGDLAINEVLNNPGDVLDPDGEWFEVVNTSGRTVILNGLVISSTVDAESHQVISSELLTLEPGEYFLFGSNDDYVTNGNVVVGYQYDGIVLSNEGDELILTADGIEIDSLAWDDGATMPDPSGASMIVDPWSEGPTTNDDPANWCASTIEWGNPGSDLGTPNATNEPCSTWDHDGDGFSGDEGDCDDTNPGVYPGAFEAADGLDTDCDGESESAPTAVADYDAGDPLTSCSPLTLDATASFDPDGEPLTYLWELSGAPSGSATTSADILTTTDGQPTFHPDVAGDYTFTVTVNDGGADSLPASITVTITDRATNTSPVAAAGADQSVSGSADCTPVSYGVSYDCDACSSQYIYLDAASSSDADGDELTYSWSVTSGSSYGTVTATGDSTAQVLISNAPATYGSANNTEVIVELTATDCMGASSTDSVTLTYACTGT